ncbi:hypothetical protein CPC08DRAFT_766286 [Agrocybe pediades]|nr:hypothetical protein CPC08DRAFT_766286 [Agrocybe pediades]
MPADRGPSSFDIKSEDDDAMKISSRSRSAGFTSPTSPVEELMHDGTDKEDGCLSDHAVETVRINGRKKPAGHIPRPPNAFMLFRSWFVKSRHVSTEVETNHSTLSKIIGMTWRSLSEEDREEWYTKARTALAEHKLKFPTYAYRPVHTRRRGSAPTKKTREVEPKDHKRCAKIAEFLASGKTGQELEEAVQEFDKYHVPEIVTRFEPPMTAETYSPVDASEKEKDKDASPSSRKLPRALSESAPSESQQKPTRPTIEIPKLLSQEPHDTEALSTTHFDIPSFSSTVTSAFDYGFGFSLHQPSPTLPRDNFLTQAVSVNSLCQPYDSTSTYTSSRHDHSLLVPSPNDYRSITHEWARNASPFSTTNSTTSVPSTPSPIQVPFSEHYEHGPFISEPPSFDYITGYSYEPLIMSDDGSHWGLKGIPDARHTTSPQAAITPNFNGFPAALPATARMIPQDPSFSSFMESISSYSL